MGGVAGRVVRFRSAESKRQEDERIRQGLAPDLAESVITSNRAVRVYLIQHRPLMKEVGPLCYTFSRVWETLRRVECDWDDAISHKEEVALIFKKDRTTLRIVPETDIR